MPRIMVPPLCSTGSVTIIALRCENDHSPPEWEVFLRANVAHFSMLDEAERDELRVMIQIFMEEKHWEGCGGRELTDEIRVTIAAQACLLLLALPHDDYYRNVESILVYPSTIVPPAATAQFLRVPRWRLRASCPPHWPGLRPRSGDLCLGRRAPRGTPY